MQSYIMMQESNVIAWYNFHIHIVDVRVLIYNFVFINTRRGIYTALLNYSWNISMRAILITSWPDFEEQHAGYQGAYSLLASKLGEIRSLNVFRISQAQELF
jgi:hypothetical protein